LIPPIHQIIKEKPSLLLAVKRGFFSINQSTEALLVGAPFRLPVVAVKSRSQISRSLLIIYLILIGLVGFNDLIMSSL
jgi:hypothetical protein